MVFSAADASRVLRELEEVILGIDYDALLVKSLPPTFVHVARPLPAVAAAASAATSGPAVLRTHLPAVFSGPPSAGTDVVVMRTPVPAFSPPAGEKRRRESAAESAAGGGDLRQVLDVLGAIRGDVAALAGRVAGVEALIGVQRKL